MRSEVAEVASAAAAFATGNPIDMKPDETERRVMEVLASPGALSLKPGQIAKQAGISRQTFWKMRQNPAFAARYHATVLDYLQGRLGEIIEATIQSALTVGREGAQDRRLLFEAAGLINSGNKAKLQTIDTTSDQLPDSELLWYYMVTGLPKKLWAPELRLRYELGQLKPQKPEIMADVKFDLPESVSEVAEKPAIGAAGQT